METAVKVSISVTMASIEEAPQQQVHTKTVLDIKPINLSNVETCLNQWDYETLVKLIERTKENG